MLKKGDFVKFAGIINQSEVIEIIDIRVISSDSKRSQFSNRVLLKYHNRLNVSLKNIESWTRMSDVEIDIQYYRDIKLKELGIC